jgi:hypothetical protein
VWLPERRTAIKDRLAANQVKMFHFLTAIVRFSFVRLVRNATRLYETFLVSTRTAARLPEASLVAQKKAVSDNAWAYCQSSQTL